MKMQTQHACCCIVLLYFQSVRTKLSLKDDLSKISELAENIRTSSNLVEFVGVVCSNNSKIDKRNSLLVTQLKKLHKIIAFTDNHFIKTRIGTSQWLINKLASIRAQGEKLVHKWILKNPEEKHKLMIYLLPNKQLKCRKGFERITLYKLVKNVMYRIKWNIYNIQK